MEENIIMIFISLDCYCYFVHLNETVALWSTLFIYTNHYKPLLTNPGNPKTENNTHVTKRQDRFYLKFTLKITVYFETETQS